jgi:putrescine transport system substrate-binding protein
MKRFVLAAMLLAGVANAQERVVNVYNWTDYIDPYAIAEFQRTTGIKVRYDVYDSLETLEAKVLAGRSGYDVIVPTSEPTFSRLVRAKALLPLDRSKIPQLAGLSADLMKRVETSDPGAAHGAIYLWGTVGLGVNRTKLPGGPQDSWDLLLKPDYAKLAAKCGVMMLDSAIDVIPSVLKYLGKSPDSTDAGDLAEVEKTLRAVRPYIRSFSSAGAVETLASGETCLALSYSGDVIQAAARAAEAGRSDAIVYVAPKEGAQLWFDMLAIPADAPHPAEAAEFINFILKPKIMAGITNQVHYANAVTATAGLVDKAISGDPSVYPTAGQMAGFFTISAVPPDAAKARSRMWQRFKSGR